MVLEVYRGRNSEEFATENLAGGEPGDPSLPAQDDSISFKRLDIVEPVSGGAAES